MQKYKNKGNYMELVPKNISRRILVCPHAGKTLMRTLASANEYYSQVPMSTIRVAT